MSAYTCVARHLNYQLVNVAERKGGGGERERDREKKITYPS